MTTMPQMWWCNNNDNKVVSWFFACEFLWSSFQKSHTKNKKNTTRWWKTLWAESPRCWSFSERTKPVSIQVTTRVLVSFTLFLSSLFVSRSHFSPPLFFSSSHSFCCARNGTFSFKLYHAFNWLSLSLYFSLYYSRRGCLRESKDWTSELWSVFFRSTQIPEAFASDRSVRFGWKWEDWIADSNRRRGDITKNATRYPVQWERERMCFNRPGW